MATRPKTQRQSPDQTGRTAAPEVRRAQLIEATIDSIAMHGLTGTTMNTVTRIAGLSMGIVNFHFRSKQNLLAETLRFLAEEFDAYWKSRMDKAGQTAAEKLQAIADSHFDLKIFNRRKLNVWFGFYGDPDSRKAYRALARDIDSDRWRVTVALCETIRAEGGYDDVDPEAVARTLDAFYDGFSINALMYPDVFSREDSRERVREYLARTFPDHYRLGS